MFRFRPTSVSGFPRAWLSIRIPCTTARSPLVTPDRRISRIRRSQILLTKEQDKGTGLGLSTVQGIVKSHGGFLRVDTKAGQGTQFSVYFPTAATVQVEQGQVSDSLLPAGNGELVLVVDDDASIRAITQAILEALDYRVLTAGDGTAAVALFAQHRDEIQIVLTDMMMPIMNRPLTIRAIRNMDPEVPILAVSGLMPNGQKAEVASLGVRVFLQKPYTAQKLLTTLAEVLDPRTKSGDGVAETAGDCSRDNSSGSALTSCGAV